MRGCQLLSPLAVFALALGACIYSVNAQLTVNVTDNSLVIDTANSTIQVYPPVDVQPVDDCPDASWKQWKLHTTPPEYDPLQWTSSQWRDYIVRYPLRSSGLSIAFLLIGLFSLLAALMWRLIQWCVSCGHCQRACGVGTQDTAFLADTKHRYLKAWIYLLIAGALGMVVWGMLAMDRTLLATFWDAFTSIMEYGQNVSDDLQQLQTDITVEVPAKLHATASTVNDTISALQLGVLVKSSIDFNNSTKSEAASLMVSSRALQAGVATGVMPGAAALAAQYGKPINATTGTQGRRLAQSSSPSASYDTLYGLVPALIGRMPAVVGADATRASIHDKLADLDSALAGFLAVPAPSGPASPEVSALAAALAAAPLGTVWEQQLDDISAGLQVYNASRNGPALGAAKDAADKVVTGYAATSPSSVASYQVRVTALSRSMVSSSAYIQLKALRVHLLNISSQVASLSGWDVSLTNGTKIGVLDMTTFLLSSLSDHIIGDTATSSTAIGTGLGAAAAPGVNVTTYIQVARNASTIAAGLNATAANVSITTADARNAAAAGPNPGPAATQIAITLRTALSAAAGPVGAVAAALTAYSKNPTASNLATLRAAATGATGPVSLAAAAFVPPLADGVSLASTAKSLGQSAAVLAAVGTNITYSTALQYTFDSLGELSTEMASYGAGLAQLLGVLTQLPDPANASESVTATATDVQTTVTQAMDNVQDRVAAAAGGVSGALSGLQNKLLSPGDKVISRLKHRTDSINRIVYPVAMGVWGLGALLLLGLAVSVGLNWPAGLVGFGLSLLALITLSQVVTSVLAFAMAVVDDACVGVELVLMRQMVQHSGNPRMAVPLSFYLYKVPTSPEVMLQAAFDLNVADVRQRLGSINSTLAAALDNRVQLQGATAALVSALRGLGSSTRNLFNAIVDTLKYETIHGLYASAKSVVCCDAGGFAYNEWCAITAAAALAFGALVSAAYLLVRMDMVGQRREGCCSCCSCVCYRPRGSSRGGVYSTGADLEAGEEDKFAKEARKQHDERLSKQSTNGRGVRPDVGGEGHGLSGGGSSDMGTGTGTTESGLAAAAQHQLPTSAAAVSPAPGLAADQFYSPPAAAPAMTG